MKKQLDADFIDWQLCVVMLRKHMTYFAIATKASACHKHIQKLASGAVSQPKFNTGVRLLDLAYDTLTEQDFFRIKKQ